MKKALITVAANTVALAIAVAIFDGIRVGSASTGNVEDLVTLVLVGVVLGVINAVIAPLAKLLSLPFIIVTLGLFLLLVNAAMLWLTAELADLFDLAFQVDGFWTYVFGALVISIVVLAVRAAVDED